MSIAGFWAAGRLSDAAVDLAPYGERPVQVLLSVATATLISTIGLGIAVSVQEGFPTVASLVNSEGVLAGGLLVGCLGLVLGPLVAGSLEWLLTTAQWDRRWTVIGVGAGVGLLVWGGLIGIAMPLVSAVGVPFGHVGSLVALVVYGALFGLYYQTLRTTFSRQHTSSGH
ncbi:hypothetical protein GJ633_00180 [Halorubrum sp. CBA1125]|uniref:hypothetical protein n=1 Tax=Halorubrum sp. CBA1125 TaxID=2668072 RepID=UPI0012E70E99|nr:hypothetical protein [Halorubrum sp. CBA1125]MUW13236.1 hypothetical protein [Halorubrum sp. CBA1125]